MFGLKPNKIKNEKTRSEIHMRNRGNQNGTYGYIQLQFFFTYGFLYCLFIVFVFFLAPKNINPKNLRNFVIKECI